MVEPLPFLACRVCFQPPCNRCISGLCAGTCSRAPEPLTMAPNASLEELLEQFEKHAVKGPRLTAEALARQLVTRFPKEERAHVALARATASFGKVQDALDMLEKLDPVAGKKVHALALLAQLRWQQGDHVKAVELAKSCVDAGGGDAHAWRVLGWACQERGEHPAAIGWLGWATRQDPADAATWKSLAHSYRSTGNPKAAAQALHHVLAANRRDVGAWVELLMAHVAAGDGELARMELEVALTQFPRDPELLKAAHVVRVLGTATSDAVAGELRTVLQVLDGGDMARASQMLDTLFKLHRPTRAMKFVRAEVDWSHKAVDVGSAVLHAMALQKQYPEAWEPRALLANLLLRKSPLKNIKLALTHADEAWSMSGGHPRAGKRLVEAFVANGRPALASAIEDQLLRLGAGSSGPG